jgi:hypothetical protein
LARGGATLPYAPEYGFLRHVPPNAIGGPGYTFVLGVGILGESCDLPSSACTNELGGKRDQCSVGAVHGGESDDPILA